MNYQEAIAELKMHNRIWHKKWNKTGFFMRDIMFGELYHLCLWDIFVTNPSNPLFSIEDGRNYSIISTFRMDEIKNHEDLSEIIRQCISLYFYEALHCLGQIGFEIKENILDENEWELVK